MEPRNDQVIALEQSLSEIGAFKARSLAIIGKEKFSEEVASLCAYYGIEVFLFSGYPPKDNIDRVKHFPLQDGKGKNRWSNLQSIPFIIVLSCNFSLIEEVLRAATPFCHIIFLGPIDGTISNIDFYSTVHVNNLELIFQPFLTREISGACLQQAPKG
jgi:hypothetical protein